MFERFGTHKPIFLRQRAVLKFYNHRDAERTSVVRSGPEGQIAAMLVAPERCNETLGNVPLVATEVIFSPFCDAVTKPD